MKNKCAFFLILIMCIPVTACTEMLGNPGVQVGEKNLFVGVEYTSAMRVYDLDTKELEIFSERAMLKVTTGLTDWLDFFIKAGGASLNMNYKENDYKYKNLGNAFKNFESDYKAGFGLGSRIRLLNFVDSGTRVYLTGGGFFLKASDNIQWSSLGGGTFIKERDIKWVDMYAGLGVSKRMDYIDLTFGVGFSELWWEIKDSDMEKTGTTVSRIPLSKRDSFEIKNPLFGFIGLDFVLPLEYRISAQAGIRNIDEAEFSISISQGLEKD